MKLCEDFIISLAKLPRNEGGWIGSQDWEAFFEFLKLRRNVRHIEETPFGFFGSVFGRKMYTVTFADNSQVRMWQWTQIEPIIDTPCAWVRYRIVAEIVSVGD